MNSILRIDLLGGLRVYPKGRPDLAITRFSTVKTASLLAYLASYPRQIHPREELADRFWPGVELEAGRSSLRAALSSLRRHLEPPGTPAGTLLISDRLSVRLNPLAFETDVTAFETALRHGDTSAALDLYRGELLPGLYDEWVLQERERLVALYEEVEHNDTRPGRSTVTEPLPPGSRVSVSNIPLVFTRCFGRQSDIAEIVRLIEGEDGPRRRLVTLSGAGGIGKTRLAIEIARTLSDSRAVYFVALADLRDASAIADRVAQFLGPLSSSDSFQPADPLEKVVAHLSSLACPLLVLDNLEHLVEKGGAAFVLTLLSRVPMLSVLATSRRRLLLADEREWLVTPLSLPPEPLAERWKTTSDLAPDIVMGSASAQLFLDRAQAARPDFQVTVRNAAAVATLCRRLDGLPLALELVAARSQSLTPSQMLQGLDQKIDGNISLVATHRREREERHRSLQAAIAWSVDLLPPPLAQFWRALSVFRGGFTLIAASVVMEEPYSLEYLTQLRERSLLQSEDAGNELRFRMLETLREFAGERLLPEERDHLSGNAARHFTGWIEEAVADTKRVQTTSWLGEVDRDLENLRAALSWCAAKRQIALGAQLSGALWNYWQPRGLLREGREWLAQFLCLFESVSPSDETPDVSELHLGRTLRAAGTLALRQSDFAAAETYFKRALTLWRQAGNEKRIADSLNNLGGLASRKGDYVTAHSFLSQGLAVLRAQGDTKGIASALNNLGTVTHFLGRSEEALVLYRECAILKREMGEYSSLITALNNAAQVALHLGNDVSAKQLTKEALSLVQEIHDLPVIADLLETLVQITVHTQEWEMAACLIGSASHLREQLGAPLTAADQMTFDQQIAAVQKALPGRDYEAAVNRGQRMPLEAILSLVAASEG
ncbi:MAG: tetratricopeptide repeat protein [Armatimonadota bacterium]